MRRALLSAPLILAGCGAPAEPSRIVPSQTGFDIAGTSLEIGFGRTRDGAVAAAARAQGKPPDKTWVAGDCVRVRWADGLSMDFRNGAFVGWRDPSARSGVAEAGDTCGA